MIIDAHQHVWNLERLSYDWLGPDLAPIDRTLTMDDIRPDLRAAGVDATVLVQSADADADTDNMLELARASTEVVAVIAWIPLDDADRAAQRLAELRRDALVVGVRALTHEYADPKWILRPEVDAGLKLLVDSGVTLDIATGGSAALGLLPELSRRHPELRIVIDHLGTPPIGGSDEELAEWHELLAAAAENPLVHAKLSGLHPRSCAWPSHARELIRPVVADALDVFGPGRLMYGGDWPISVLAGGYASVWTAISGLIDELAPTERSRIFGETAAEFYRIDAGRLARAEAF